MNQVPDAALRALVEADWSRQEPRWGRTADSPAALQAALARARATLEHSPQTVVASGPAPEQTELAALERTAAALDPSDTAGRIQLYRQVRWFTRNRVLSAASVTQQPLLFMQRQRFVCQMLHEYMGYFCDYGDVAGGGIRILERPGQSLETRELIQGRLPKGNFTTLALSPDARTVYFAFAERSERKPNFYSPQRRSFHLYRLAPDGSDLRQLTDGVEDDFDPCPLPDGGVAFMSTRRGGFARCNNAWEPCATYTLHRLEADGREIHTLSRHETSEWHPSVLNDGRLAYIRWDYVDRSAANFHGIWLSRPDGSGVESLFGNYTTRINACYQPKAIPGSQKLLFVAGAHHADVGGSLVLLDPRRAALDALTGEDRFEAIEVLTPEVCFPESVGWPKSYFHSPWPLSETAFLVAFSFDPLPGMSSGEGRDTRTGLYYFDRLGNFELLYFDPTLSSMYPIPLAPRASPPVVAAVTDPSLGDEGEFLVADVRRSLFPLPTDRPIRELRVFQLLPKIPPHTANEPRIGHANAENARLLLGSVPVEADGSAYFRVPAGKPVYFQLVDDAGRAVQSMRSATYLQPGERRACVGCHESPGTAPPTQPALAFRRPPSTLRPGPDGSRPLSFPRLVQPVLERHCVRCHDGTAGPNTSRLVLTSERVQTFTRAYVNLKPYLRWYEWGGASISQIATHPGDLGADASPLTRIVEDPTHRSNLTWSEAERRRLYLWLDANAPFYGTYDPGEQTLQHAGAALALPKLQ